jgi:hypothetical protein
MEEVRLLNVLVDVNLLLDVFLLRDPWVAEAQALWTAHHRRLFVGHIADLDAIVTRDPKGFAGSPVPVLSPAELLAQLPKGDPA